MQNSDDKINSAAQSKWMQPDFLLSNKTACKLYHGFAAVMPIIDYHNHLPVAQIAGSINFANLTQAWLYGDHYKWRAMRTNGINEKFCTGNAGDFEKFQQWAATVPYTLRNPLYHWSHLELKRYFGIDDLLSPVTCNNIYEQASSKLITEAYSVKNLLRKMNAEIVCTTDDPVDTLEHHQKIKQDNFEVKVLPAFRPDKAMEVTDAKLFNEYVNKVEQASNTSISNFDDYLSALKKRHDYFALNGCVASDHGLDELYADDYTASEITTLFSSLRKGNNISSAEIRKFKSAMLITFAEWDYEAGWVQQYHLGALRNNNTKMMHQAGPDTGWDSIGDNRHAHAIAKFLNHLNSFDKLTKTIIYNLNPADNAMLATMIGNFNDGSIAAKIQWGAAWWFLDQKDGITEQINTLSNMGMLSKFVGMLTDSRSFLSFPRHEYFRRILCNIFGEEIENGELPNDINWTGKIIQDICYHNTKQYFGWV